MDSSLKKIIKLIQKTGDRFVVSDLENETPYVIMPFRDYEYLTDAPRREVASLTEGELLEKINRDIFLWKSRQIEEETEEDLENQTEEKTERGNERDVWEEEMAEKSLSDVNNSFPSFEEKEPAEESKKEEIGNEQVEDEYYFEPLEP